MTGNNSQTTGGNDIEVSRRGYVASVAALGSVGLAGCSDILGGGGGGSGPEATIRGFYDAAKNGNVEEVNSYIHPDGPEERATQQQLDSFQQANVSIESIDVVEEGEQRATVDVTATVQFGEETSTSTSTFELRRHEDEWKIWSTGNAS